MTNVNDYCGKTDNETIENAIRNRQADGIIVIPPRQSGIEPDRNYWLLDRAILIPENTTVILQNCKIKLSDRCRDNFFRSVNCGIGIEYPEKIENIHIRGEGLCVLEGADHPRAVGDGTKILANPCPYEIEDLCRFADWVPEEEKKTKELSFWSTHVHSYGTDAGIAGESQYGDWRGIGILFANVDHFSIENLKIVDTHGWGISIEAGSNGRIEKIEFDMCMSKVIDEMRQNMENQDGIDIRNGCHHIVISDITGRTGDDVIALTAIAHPQKKYFPGGSLRTTHVMHNDWTKRDPDIHDIIIKNVIAHSNLCYVVRILPGFTKIWNVVMDNIIDTKPDDLVNGVTIAIGSDSPDFGDTLQKAMWNYSISNVISQSEFGIMVFAPLRDSVISNIVNSRSLHPTLTFRNTGKFENVKVNNISSAMEEE